MEYTIGRLARLSGVSVRTLRYYDEIGLLKPCRITSSGYRIYGREQLNALQQILFHRELDMPLCEIGRIQNAPDFDRERALMAHLQALTLRRERLDTLIANAKRSLSELRGGEAMDDKAKFSGFAAALVDENERQYGAELRERYGDETVDASNAHVRGMTREQYERAGELSKRLSDKLREAMRSGDPAGAAAQEACALHREWLCIFYPGYNREYHRALGEMYVADARFSAYYDQIAPGCAEFLCKAIAVYCA